MGTGPELKAKESAKVVPGRGVQKKEAAASKAKTGPVMAESKSGLGGNECIKAKHHSVEAKVDPNHLLH